MPFSNALRLIALTVTALLLSLSAAHAQDPYFEIDALNTGLPAPPDRVDRTSPHAAMASLVDLAAADDPAAAHLLDLAEIAPADQPQRGPDLAQKLVDVLDRKVILDWNDLLARPDGMDANTTSRAATAGQPRRSILLGILDGPQRPVALRLNRVKPPDGDPVWLISRESVAQIDALHVLYGPSKLESRLPERLRRDAFWGLKWWEVAGLPLVFLAASLAGALAHHALSQLSRGPIGRIGTRALQAARLPAVIAAVTVTVAVLRRFFIFSGLIDTVLTPAVVLGFVVATLIFLVNVVDELLEFITPRNTDTLTESGREEARARATKVSVARRLLIVAVFILGVGIVLSSANVAASFGMSLLASAGVVTLVFGFAAREILANILSSLQIAMNQSARVGDKIVYADRVCTVERINFTYVQLRVWTGIRLIVPVREFVSEHFENWSLRSPRMISLVELRLAHSAPVDRMREAFDSILRDLDPEQLDDLDKSETLVTDHDIFGQSVTFCVACASDNTAWEIACHVREKLIAHGRQLERDEGLTIFPTANPAEAA